MTNETIQQHFDRVVPGTWFTGSPTIESDDEEILCTGVLPNGTSVEEFREETRAERMAIAAEAQSRFQRTVSWGVESSGGTTLFTTLNMPTMTRLRLRERAVLDTLIDAGIARSRSEALAWCVKLVGRNQAEWLEDLRSALVHVDQLRREGPTLV